MKKIFTTIFAVLFTLPALADKTITGTVVDADTNDILIGATIRATDNLNIGAISDHNGFFHLEAPNTTTQIIISYIGYEPETVNVPPNNNMGDVKLTPTSLALEEAVIVGNFISKDCNAEQLNAVNAKSGKTAIDEAGKIYCVPDSCVYGYKYDRRKKTCDKLNCTGRYKLNADGDDCEDKDGKACTEYNDSNATKAEYEWDGNDLNCKITKCNKNYVPSDDGTKCELSEGPCTPDQLEKIEHATAGELKNKICYVTECDSGYKVNKKTNRCDELNCTGRYKLNADGDDCEDQVGKECKSSDTNAKKSEYKWINKELVCVIQKCVDGYLPNDNGTACEKSEGLCSDEQLKMIEHATAGELKKGICHATACDGGYEPSDGKCVAISGDCDPMPEHATAAHREWDTTTNTEICIIDRCGDEYRPSNDRRSCIRPTLTEEESQKKIEELQKNADAMRETEQSTANKLLGGASIAATGIGGMQLASAIAENRADDAAERDMAAYLATFRCDYGQGRNIMGGETDVQLPGGNNLIELKQQFMELAADLKVRKDALEMTPGIESEVILDSANMGLYDDESLGITDGAYTSLSRALSDPDGADAAEWAQQRSDTKSQLTTGAVMAGVGIVGGVVGNLLINRDAPDEKSDEINLKYEPLKKLRDDTEKLPDNSVGAQCPSDATGTYPDCECTDTKHVYNGTANKCEECTGDKVAITSTTCGCPDGTISSTDDTCIERQTGRTPECNPDTPNIKVDLATGKCLCINGYILTDAKTCECPDDTHKILQNGVCVEKTGQQITIPECAILPAENLFALNSAQLTDGALLAIGEFAGDVKNAQGDDKIYCITVNGYTDTSGTETYNQRLSTQRAEAVKTALIKAKIPETNIQANGYGETNCKYENGKLVPDGIRYKNCRRVEIGFSPNACQ